MASPSNRSSLEERLARLRIDTSDLRELYGPSPTSSTSTIMPSSTPDTMPSNTPDATPSTTLIAALVATPAPAPSVDDEAKCAICQERFISNYINTPCQHKLHVTCLRELLVACDFDITIRCPYCRADFSWAREESLKCMISFDIHGVTWRMACMSKKFRPDLLLGGVTITTPRLPILHLPIGEVFSVLQRSIWDNWRETSQRRCPRDETCKHKFISPQVTDLQNLNDRLLDLELRWNSLDHPYRTIAAEHWSTYITELLRSKYPTLQDMSTCRLKTCWMTEIICELLWLILLFEALGDRISARGGFLNSTCFRRWFRDVAEMVGDRDGGGSKFIDVAKGVVDILQLGLGSAVSSS